MGIKCTGYFLWFRWIGNVFLARQKITQLSEKALPKIRPAAVLCRKMSERILNQIALHLYKTVTWNSSPLSKSWRFISHVLSTDSWQDVRQLGQLKSELHNNVSSMWDWRSAWCLLPKVAACFHEQMVQELNILQQWFLSFVMRLFPRIIH